MNEEREEEFDGEWEKTLSDDRPASKITASAYPSKWEKPACGG